MRALSLKIYSVSPGRLLLKTRFSLNTPPLSVHGHNNNYNNILKIVHAYQVGTEIIN